MRGLSENLAVRGRSPHQGVSPMPLNNNVLRIMSTRLLVHQVNGHSIASLTAELASSDVFAGNFFDLSTSMLPLPFEHDIDRSELMVFDSDDCDVLAGAASEDTLYTGLKQDRYARKARLRANYLFEMATMWCCPAGSEYDELESQASWEDPDDFSDQEFYDDVPSVPVNSSSSSALSETSLHGAKSYFVTPELNAVLVKHHLENCCDSGVTKTKTEGLVELSAWLLSNPTDTINEVLVNCPWTAVVGIVTTNQSTLDSSLVWDSYANAKRLRADITPDGKMVGFRMYR
eukprot:TRINITY_DN2824_c0_g3_i1.p1 TRINITY_DN2824_c0_g3~~TRINITY_DN2824_c0_g3_i1.p1  ORF type:complete len:329 (+),score=26.46 TRINITY_DN2824_c0_g3_i1:123-989(+)